MDQQSQNPTKNDVRKYMERRVEAHKPPPDQKKFVRQLGWELFEKSAK